MLSHVRRYFFTYLLLVTVVFTAGASGYVQVRNFTKEEYSGGAQNWACVQDSVGRIYVGNRDGMLVFDGQRWRKLFLPNYTTVRSLYFDKEARRIYAGGSEEMGYFTSDPHTGILHYTSLLNCFPKNQPHFTEIWNICKCGENMWFQADNHVFCLKDDFIKVYPLAGRISTSAVIGKDYYVALVNGSILMFDNGRFKGIKGADELKSKKITALLPMESRGKLLVGTSVDGLFVYDGQSVAPFTSSINDFLKNNQLFCAARHGEDYVFGTVNSGAVTYNSETKKISYINKETGLQNNTVLNVTFDRAGNFLLCLDNGFDYALYNSQSSILVTPNHSIGAGYTSMLNGNNMLFGTNQGLYTTPYPIAPAPMPSMMERLLHGQIWSLSGSPHGIFVAADAGLFVYGNGNLKKIEGIPGAYRVTTLQNDSSLALASTYDNFHLLKYDGSKWTDIGEVEGYDDINGNFIIDTQGNIWLPHWRKGVYRLKLDIPERRFQQVRLYNHADGFPTDENNNVALFDGKVVFSTEGGFYKLDSSNQHRIIADDELNSCLSDRHAGVIQALPDESMSYVSNDGIFIFRRRADGKISVTRTTTGNLRDQIIPGFVHLNAISPDEMIVSTQDGFTSVRSENRFSSAWQPAPLVSAIYANRDSLIYTSPLTDGKEMGELKLPFNLNSLRFEFGFAEFDSGEQTEFSSYLENYDNDWSPYGTESAREYTRLSDGDYIMHVRVRDLKNGQIRQASFGFSVMPPWFRTPLAKICYAIIIIILLISTYRFAQKWAKNAGAKIERRKERELNELRQRTQNEAVRKDFEIASLKNEQLEQDIKHKSQELSNTTMNLIRMNEVLTDIANQISNIQQMAAGEGSRTAVVRQLAKIKTSIENTINGDKDAGTFYTNFDRVYGDYTKRLMERFPTLSHADKRLCCFIRMGLSSKEIAPLINISAKSVEMARYRLRKKLAIPTDTSLTDFLNAV